MREGAMLLATLLPARNGDVVAALAARRVTAFSTDLIPRITRAQAMDTLSSMATIAGYQAVLLAASALPRFFPMLMTAAGTVFPAKVFVIGAGVAGLQAIATARRLGAVVEATDIRPAVREQIESLGAQLRRRRRPTSSAQDAGGYAKELSPEFYRRQRELIAERCAGADVVITTALIGGIKAPRLITAEMVRAHEAGLGDRRPRRRARRQLRADPPRRDGGRGRGDDPRAAQPAVGDAVARAARCTRATSPRSCWRSGRTARFDLDLDDEIIRARWSPTTARSATPRPPRRRPDVEGKESR